MYPLVALPRKDRIQADELNGNSRGREAIELRGQWSEQKGGKVA